MKETVMKNFFAVVVSFLMLSGVALSAGPAAPAPAAPEKQKPAKEAKVKKQHLKKSELTKGVYVSVKGGLALRQDSDVNDVEVAVDDGFAYTAAIGKRIGAFDKRVRVEGEIGYQKTDIDGIDSGKKVSGDMKAYTFLVNGYFDFVHGKKLVPYLTAGIGLAKVDADVDSNKGGIAHVDDTGLAYQVGVGIAYHINDNWHIDLKYRYLGVTSLNGIEIDGMNPEFKTNNIFLGLRYRF
jgi:OOP family OmpA-OmpF porin